ncbi:MAG: alcohol dehydrogenase catalytic domain-containing protein [Planctomycetes bacterium]|nr:alcohol dehydrogenase catalytic domain-containing protein [Planctomycetota bacterium]
MKAAVYRGVNRIEYEDVPVPEIGPDEILVRIAACGLCQSDIKKILYPLYEPPRIFGHEMAGVIERAGPDVQACRPGDRVAVMHHIPCLRCGCCLREDYSLCKMFKELTTTAGFIPSGGGFAQFIRVPGHIVRHGVIPIPGNVSFEEATFVEPVNCCLKAVRKAGVAAGDRVLVVGAGPMGLLFVQILKFLGAVPFVSEPLAARRDKALELGVEGTFDPSESRFAEALRDATGGLGPDLVLLAVPHLRACECAFSSARPGGKILFFAEFPEEVSIPVRPNLLYRSEITLLGSYSSSFKLQGLSADIVFNRRINVRALLSREFPLARLAEAVDLALHPAKDTLKIVIRPWPGWVQQLVCE